MDALNKTIFLVRHAKSSWSSGAATDFERPLSKRGQKDAVRMGEKLKSLGWKVEKVISSPASRAQQTCQIVCNAMAVPVDSIEWNKDIYAAYTISLLHILSNLPETVNSVMLVGHNPAMEELLVHLCGYAETDALRQANGKLFTTCNVARLSAPVTWKNLVMHQAELEQLLRPKEL